MINIYNKNSIISKIVSSLLILSFSFSPVFNLAIASEAEETNEEVESIETKEEVATSTEEIVLDEDLPVKASGGGPDQEETTSVPEESIESISSVGSTTPEGVIEVRATTTGSGKVEVEESVASTTIKTSEFQSDTETTEIKTKDSISAVSVSNVANTNIFNSQGVMMFLNNIISSIDTIDLRSLPFLNLEDNCSDIFCNKDIEIKNTNEAEIKNSIIVRSQTGNNEIETEYNGSIETGNAYSVADVINISNSNIIDSNYALMVINNFGDWDGDFILPGKEKFKDFFSPKAFTTNATNTNEAEVVNNVKVVTKTGNNEAEAGSSNIESGESNSFVNIINKINSNLTNGEQLAVVFKVHGNWLGEIYNQPDNVVWEEKDNSLSFYLKPDGSGGSNSNLTVENNNKSKVTNDVEVYALTGDNKIKTDQSANIKTGKAYAGANIVNIANTNVISQNWIYAIVNVFGDWRGNVSFGQPDLWVGAMIDEDKKLSPPGSSVTYTYTISNKGDNDASNIVFQSTLDSDYVKFSNQTNQISKNIPKIKAGEIYEFTETAEISSDAPADTLVTNNIEVKPRETDNNYDDNNDFVTLTINQSQPASVSYGFAHNKSINNSQNYPNLKLTKSFEGNKVISAPTEVTFNIKIYNDSKYPAYNAKLEDIITNQFNQIINTEKWELDKILPYEEIVISYTIAFNKNTSQGIYKNSAKVTSTSETGKTGEKYNSNVSSTEVEILNTIQREEVVCTPLLSTYILNDELNKKEEIIRLQNFLNKEMGTNLEVTGHYDNSTKKAIEEFQVKYKDDILKPWDINHPTGNVYFTTRNKINELHCGNTLQFSLSSAQLAEINSYKNRAKEVIKNVIPQANAKTKTEKPKEKKVERVGYKIEPVTPKEKKSFMANVFTSFERLFKKVINLF